MNLATYPLPVLEAVSGNLEPPQTLNLTDAKDLKNRVLQTRLDAGKLAGFISGRQSGPIGPADERRIELLLGTTRNCELWQNSFINLTKKILLLSPEQLAPAWQAIENSPACQAEKAPWLQLAKAVSQRDMATALAISRTLQEREPGQLSREFLELIEVTALVSLGQYQVALEKISVSEILKPDQHPNQHIALSLLHAHASLAYVQSQVSH